MKPTRDQVVSRYHQFLTIYKEVTGESKPTLPQREFIDQMAELYESQKLIIDFYRKELVEVFEDLRKLNEKCDAHNKGLPNP